MQQARNGEAGPGRDAVEFRAPAPDEPESYRENEKAVGEGLRTGPYRHHGPGRLVENGNQRQPVQAGNPQAGTRRHPTNLWGSRHRDYPSDRAR